MRIGLIAEQLLAPVPGGTGRYTRELAEALQRNAADDDELTAWTAWHRDRSAAQFEGIATRALPLPRRALVAAWERGRFPSPRGAEVVHATTLLAPAGVRHLVVTVHDTVPWTHPETLTPRGVRWHKVMAARVAAEAAAVVVPTQTVADELRAVLPGMDAARLHVLGAGVARVFRGPVDHAETQRVRRHHDLPGQYLLCVATLEPRKGLDVLVGALARLGPDAPVVAVVGAQGWGGVDLSALAARSGLPPGRVRALGRITDAELLALMHGAFALVAPSRAEGFGLPVAEAMAAGTPVICSDAPALIEVGGDAVWVVAREDVDALAGAIAGLAADPGRCSAMRKAGLSRSMKFDWDSVAQRAWALYRSLT